MTHQETHDHQQHRAGMCPVERDLFVNVIQADLDREAARQQQQQQQQKI